MFVHRSLPTEVRDSHTIPVEGGPGDISRQLADAHKTTGQATGIVYLAGLGEPVDVLTLPKDQFEERWRKQYSLLFAVSREYYRDLIEAGIAAVFAAVTNTGGAFGLKPMETGNALGALGVGFAKSLAKEIPNLRLRCIDIGRASFANAADLLVSELSADDSATDDDIAYIGGQRHVIKVVPASLPTATALTQPASTSPGVVVFSGGSRGIALECAIRLAELSDYRIALLGRSTLDDPLSLPYLHQDDQRFLELQPTILRKLHDTDPDLKPVELQLAYRRIANNRRLFQAIARLRSRSLPIEYVTCDVTDLQQVKGAISDISRRLGTVRGVVHAAGLESLGLLPKKDYAYGEQLVGVKVSGLYNLVNSVSIEALDFLLAFTSISGRFGMDGQTDYTAASAMLSTLCSQLATRYRDTRIVAMDWTAWSGTGMATHESVRQIQEGERGLTYMDPEEGCAHFLRELSFGGANSQVMVFGSLGSNEPRSALDCLTEDRRTLRSPISRGSVVDVAAYPLIDTACDVTPEASSANFREYTRRIDPRIDHFMEDHAVRGIPTLPAVFHLEIMTEAARLATGTESLVIQTATFKRFVKCRHERTCDLLVETRINGDEIVAEVFADVVDPSGSILVRKQPRSRSVLTARPRVIDPGFFTTHQGDVADRATTFDLDAYYEAAAPYIAFGPSFRLLTDAWRTSKGIVAGWFQIPRNSRLWLSPGDARLSTEPVLVDSVGRLALIDVYDKYGDHVVPVELTGAVVLRHALPGSQVLGRVKVAPEGDDSYSLTLLITDPDGDPFLKVDRILLRRIGHDDAHQGLAKTRH
jgi:NAD(P)-dependent dehydrogenase (short-subunit alcohol dehydrogenase family)